MHSVKSRGLSAVRPLMRAHLGCLGDGSSPTDVPKTVPYLAVESLAHSPNFVTMKIRMMNVSKQSFGQE